MISERAFAIADFDSSEFQHISKMEDPPILRMPSVHSTRMFGTTLTLPSSAVCGKLRRLKKRELPKNVNVVTGKWIRN